VSRRTSQVQRKRRRRQFDPLRAAGGYHPPTRHGIWYRIFHNKWIVFGGMGVITVGMVGGTICGAQLTSTDASNSVRNNRIIETATPEAPPTPTPDPNATPTPAPPPTATPPVRRYAAVPELTIDTAKQYVATLKTEKGDIKLELYPAEAPQAVNNFVFLARNDFYDGLTFHRVLENFVAQGGDPDGSGAGGPGYFLPVERNNLKHETGAIAMARSPQGISGSQFYITFSPQPNLDAQGFTVFGKVTDGMDALRALTRRDPAQNPRAAPGTKILDIQIDER
jgi:cyclophilin family peptidyl-prolyl cis-trans isomerase